MTDSIKLTQYREHVSNCRRCRACDGVEYPNGGGFNDHPSPWAELAGSLSAKLVIVGKDFSSTERQHIHPDLKLPTNKNLRILIATAGLTRDDVYLTNAILCWKPGKMPSPVQARWLHNCSRHLVRTIDIISPIAVAGLGVDGYRATCMALGLKAKRMSDVIGRQPEYTQSGIALFGLAHCGGLGTASRSLCLQREDWAKLGLYLRDHACAA